MEWNGGKRETNKNNEDSSKTQKKNGEQICIDFLSMEFPWARAFNFFIILLSVCYFRFHTSFFH